MKIRLLTPAIALLLVLSVIVVGVMASNGVQALDNSSVAAFTSAHSADSVMVDIPDQAQVKENGYPKNENGESYGPDIYANTYPEYEPDLILAQNEDGVIGYIKKTDIKGGAETLEEALNWKPQENTVPMYLEDGITVIGEFRIG